MKINVKELRQKKVQDLEKMVGLMYEEILKLKLSQKSAPAKDTNIIFKKRKQLAVMLTLIAEKKELEKIGTNK